MFNSDTRTKEAEQSHCGLHVSYACKLYLTIKRQIRGGTLEREIPCERRVDARVYCTILSSLSSASVLYHIISRDAVYICLDICVDISV